jgi:uncharacterized protein YggE
MKTTFFTSFLFVLISIQSLAQIQTSEIPFIEVTGTAEMEVIPDMIYLKIVIGEKNSGTKSKISIQEQEDSLKASLNKLKVDLSKLSLSDAASQYIKVNWGKSDVLTTKEYSLLLADAETLGKVFKELDRLKVSNAYISKVDHSQIKIFKQQVRINAIQAAKQKADYMLSAIGNAAGKPLIIREQQPIQPLGTFNDELRFRGARASNTRVQYIDGAKVKEEDSVIQFQKIKLEYGVYAKFEIK